LFWFDCEYEVNEEVACVFDITGVLGACNLLALLLLTPLFSLVGICWDEDDMKVLGVVDCGSLLVFAIGAFFLDNVSICGSLVLGLAIDDLIEVDILERDVDFMDVVVLESVSDGEVDRLVLLLLIVLYIGPVNGLKFIYK
jgi:hypothetical protein